MATENITPTEQVAKSDKTNKKSKDKRTKDSLKTQKNDSPPTYNINIKYTAFKTV